MAPSLRRTMESARGPRPASRARLAAAALAAIALSACASAPVVEETASLDAEPWLQASQVLFDQISDQVKRVPYTHGMDRVRLIEWFASVGEPAYEQLLEMAADPRPDVSATAVAALGASRDSRLVEPMRAVEWAPTSDQSLRMEKARAFLRLGDWSEMHVLIDGLEDEDLWTRAWCSQALHESTGQRFGYDPKGPAEERAASIKLWEDWMQARRTEGILFTARG